MIGWLESAAFRFSLSGTLILAWMVADRWIARRAAEARRPHPPRWTAPFIFASLTAYYLLIGPTGGPIAGGWGNLAGFGLFGASLALRTTGWVRRPDLGARALFYVALPVAVGVPWGLLALSLPACAASVASCLRAERDAAAGVTVSGRRYRLLPGLW